MAGTRQVARALTQPYYLLRPAQALRRFRRAGDGEQTAALPWGHEITFDSAENIGRALLHKGIFDLAVTETLTRLTDPGDLAVDVGANIGYMTSVLVSGVGPSGSVICFEPHPEIYERLVANTHRWPGDITPLQMAIGDQEGTATLHVPEDFQANQGRASLLASDDTRPVEVRMGTLDSVVPDRDIGVLKIDVEGFEEAALRGARSLLVEGRIRDVIFETHDPYPSDSTRLVEEAGMRLYGIDRKLLGVRLREPEARPTGLGTDSPSLLATRDPERAEARLRPHGWRALRGDR